MMKNSCYVYAIVPREARIPAELTGLHDAALLIVPCQDLAAVISPIDSAALPALPVYLLRHEAVVEALCQAGQALPARFGTILADQAVVAQAIAEKYEVLRADLARVGDKVELGLTVLWERAAEQDEAQAEQPLSQAGEAPASGAPHAGIHYLEARLAHYRQEAAQHNKARALIADLEQALRPHTLEQRYRMLATPRLVVRAAYLVHPRHIKDFQHAVDEIRQRLPGLRWLVSGPWPPYTFVTGAGRPFRQGAGLNLAGPE